MQLIGIILAVLLVLTMLPTIGLQSAFADEAVERPATTGGGAALEGFEGDGAAASAEAAVAATQRGDGTLVADGLVYAAIDGGLSLVGFDGLPQGDDAPKEIVVPEAVSVDGKDTPVAAVAIAEGNVAEGIISLTLPQTVNNIDTAPLAAAFPNLASVEVALPKASAPVAVGAAAMKAAYSSFAGILYKNVREATESGASAASFAKELVWAPPAMVVARIPAECTSIASGAFADCANLKTVVCFGVMNDIAAAQKAEDGAVSPGAFTDEQIQTVNVIVPQTGTVVPDPDGGRVSADVAVTDHSTMDVKREAWWKSGFASDRITLGEVYGSTTNTLPVTEEGVLETTEAEVAYAPETTQNSSSRKAGIEPPESAIPTPVPDDVQIDLSESGLVFTHLADMTLSVSWKGDPTATPAHLDIPAYATINGVTYPVTEITPRAFEGAVFLTSVTIPEGVTTIGEGAFKGCANLTEPELPPTAKAISVETSASSVSFGEDETNYPTPSQLSSVVSGRSTNSDRALDYYATPEGSTTIRFVLDAEGGISAFEPVANSITPAGSLSIDASGLVTYTGSYLLRIETDRVNHVSILTVHGNGVYTGEKAEFAIGYSAGYKFGSMVIESGDGTSSKNINYKDVIYPSGSTINVYVYASSQKPDLASYATKGDLETLQGELTKGLGTKLDSSAISDYDSNEKIKAALDAKATTASVSSLAGTVNGKADSSTVTALSGTVEAVKSTAEATSATADQNKADIANLNSTTVKSSDFASVTYAGLDEVRNGSAFPGSFRKGSSPALPAPEREGQEFLGWTFGDDVDEKNATKDRTAIEGYFKAATGDARLTAHWEEAEPDVSEAKHFFTSQRPLRFDDASERQTHVIKVRLSNVPRTLASVSFEGDDRTRLLKDTSGVELYVGASEDALSSGTRLAWGGSTGSGWTCDLAELAEGSYGVYVGISVPTSAVDEASVPVSYTDGSYVASLVKMNYVFA